MKNRNVRLLISLIALIACTAVVYFLQQSEDRAMVDPSLFKVEGLDRIDSIVLTSARGNVNLGYLENRWTVDGKYKADAQLIEVFFAAVKQVIPKRPVAAIRRDSVNDLIDRAGVTVNFFEGSVLQTQFQVAGNQQKNETYFRRDKNAEPYIVTIPGYRVYVSQIFEWDEYGWRDKRVFNFNWRNFTTLAISFPQDPASDVTISRPDMKVLAVGVVGIAEPDTARVNAYLDDIIQLRADQIIPAGFSKWTDSLAGTAPVASIRIDDIASRNYRLDLFAPPKGEASFLGRTHENDLVLLDRKKVFRILKKRAYFKLIKR